SKEPCERELAGRAVLLARQKLDTRHEIEILLKVFPLEARREAAVVILGQIREALDLSGKEASTERAVGNEGNAEPARRGENIVLGVARPKRVLGLQCGDGMNSMRPANRRRRCLGKAEIADFTVAHK